MEPIASTISRTVPKSSAVLDSELLVLTLSDAWPIRPSAPRLNVATSTNAPRALLAASHHRPIAKIFLVATLANVWMDTSPSRVSAVLALEFGDFYHRFLFSLQRCQPDWSQHERHSYISAEDVWYGEGLQSNFDGIKRLVWQSKPERKQLAPSHTGGSSSHRANPYREGWTGW